MQSESGSGGIEYARTREVPIARAEGRIKLAMRQTAQAAQSVRERRRTEAEKQILEWAEAQVQLERAQVHLERTLAVERGRARTQAEEERLRTRVLAQPRERVRPEVEAQVEVWARAQAKARAEKRVQTLAEAQPREVAQEVRALALAEAQAAARAKVRAKVQEVARAEALARALARARVGMVDEMPLLATPLLMEALDERGLTPFLRHAVQSHPPTYAEVLADLKIKAILDSIDSIKPNYRPQLTRDLWGHSEHWWLIQIIVPVTRLPPELLQSILYTIIDDASNSPLPLMLVCEHWYTAVTSIWAPLKLGTRTPRAAVTNKLERNPPLLDVVVDTEIDRGDFTPSEAAYEAIFASIEAISRWRSLIVETFPAQADLPEHLVNRGLQRCSNATMSRLKTFKVKSACEISPFLDRLLRILGITASPQLTTVEINSANAISFLAPAYLPFVPSKSSPSIFRGGTIQSTFSLTYINWKHFPPLISPFPSMRMTSTYHL